MGGEPQHELPPSSPQQVPPQSSSPAPDFHPTSPAEPARHLKRRPIHPSPTLPSLDTDARIPSSKSPSPMKLPPSSIPGGAPTQECHPGLGDVAKALQKTLTTLLGKRSSDEDDTSQTRKRPRPKPPSKVNYVVSPIVMDSEHYRRSWRIGSLTTAFLLFLVPNLTARATRISTYLKGCSRPRRACV